ncbi:hypothetical protein B0H21DRAFT_689033 [Amylocystis lapponica]|nr:hypothetical protein B0H21DRAFT_689033 [Amylocystis lapponica]
MSSFSSLSSVSVWPSPPPSSRASRSGNKQTSRSRPPRIGTRTTHSRPTSDGCRARYLDDYESENQQQLPSSSKAPSCSPKARPLAPGPSYLHDHDSCNTSSYVPATVTKVRGSTGADCIEASRLFRASGTAIQTPGLQTHQIQHAGSGRKDWAPLVRSDVAPVSPYTSSLSSSPSSPSLPPPVPSTPRRHYPTSTVAKDRSYAYLVHHGSVSSFASQSAGSLGSPFPEPSTPSPSPRSHRSRSHRSVPISAPTSPPPTFLVRRGIVPQPTRPTLAMSMQIHAPSPIMSSPPVSLPTPSLDTRHRSRSRPPSSRPSSPLVVPNQLPSLSQRPPMTRPPSRSERLLRDTLRRAEEHDRVPLPPLSPRVLGTPLPANGSFATSSPNGGAPTTPRRHRRSTSSVESCDACDYIELPSPDAISENDQEQDEDQDDSRGWLWRSGSGSSSSSGFGQGYHYQPRPAELARRGSQNRGTRTPDISNTGQMTYGTPTSPSPARTQRPGTMGSNAPRGSCAVHSHSHSNSRTSLDGERSSCTCSQGSAMTPHEAVLRTRLEGVLRSAKEQERRAQSSERRDRDHGLSSGSGSGSGNSMASSRNLSAEGDFFFGVNVDSSVTSLASNDSKHFSTPSKNRSSMHARNAPTNLNLTTRPPPMSHPSQCSPSASIKSLGSPAGSQRSNGVSPLTPPPSPPFNARTAAAQCRTIDGYVSFANIEGLGVPDGDDADSEDEDGKARGRWWHWLSIPGGKTGDRSRGRSESASSAASR